MCGIAGAHAPGGLPRTEVVAPRLEAMAAAVAHRGPDDRGVWCDAHAGLAATRLAIVDLSAAGHQPMHHAGAAIAFNGEIYNFRELRRELAAAGHRFVSGTDTEVVLHGYAAWGERVVDRLRGMFAFAIWDAPARRLLLARDRLGQKPLYYTVHGGTLVFGSEVKAILAWPGIPRRPRHEAIHQYLTLRYVPGEHTAFEGIRRLPPAHLLIAGDHGQPRVRRYWARPAPVREGAAARAALVLDRFDEAVRLRLAADVPVGAFLSGGIDSSSVVAAMARAAPGTVRTFTVGFPDPRLDERPAARLVAERYATRHTEVEASVDLPSIAARIAWHYGEPFADPVAIATYLLAEEARRHVKVVLTGDGGDETFLGYRRHAASRLAAVLDLAPRRLRAAIASAARRRLGTGQFAGRFLGVLDRPPAARYGTWVAYLSPALAAELYDGELGAYAGECVAEVFRPWFAGPGNAAEQAAAADLDRFLPDDLLVRIDVATMAHGLEARSPFLDHELVELASSLPVATRMPRYRNKGLLRSLMAPRLPPALLRKPKLGFPMPLDLHRPSARELVHDALGDDAVRARGLFRPSAVARLLREHETEGGREQQVWTLVMLELWYRTWIDPPAAPV